VKLEAAIASNGIKIKVQKAEINSLLEVKKSFELAQNELLEARQNLEREIEINETLTNKIAAQTQTIEDVRKELKKISEENVEHLRLFNDQKEETLSLRKELDMTTDDLLATQASR
jgi:predicted nuclease with TOPRIM domain